MPRVRRLLYWVPALVWMGVIFLGSTGLLASQQTSRFLAPLLRWLWPGLGEAQLWQWIFLLRKTAHVAEYALLAVLILAALHRSFRLWLSPWCWRKARQAWLLATAYAVTDEIHQAFEPTRFGSPLDVLLDSAGAGLALILWWLAGRWRRWW